MWSTNPAASSSTMRHRHSSSSEPVSSSLTSSFPSLGESVHGKISQDHVQAFLARYKLVICMNLCVLFFLCGFSGLFGSGSSSGSGTAANRRGGSSAMPLSKSYSSYMDHYYSSSSPHKRNNKGMLSSSVSNGRLRGVVGGEAPTLKDDNAPLPSAPPGLYQPPPRFVPGTLPQQSAPVAMPPVASATAAATATATAAVTPKSAQPEAEVVKKPEPQAINKKEGFLNTLSSSTKNKEEEQAAETIFKPGQSEVLPPAMVEEIKKEKEMQEMRMQSTGTGQVAAKDPVQCSLSKDADEGKALTEASVEEVAEQKGQEEATTLPPAAAVEPGDIPLCPHTPPPSLEAELKTMDDAENTATGAAATTEMDLTAPGVSLNSDLAQNLPVVEAPEVDVETAASASVSTPIPEEAEPMTQPAAAQPCQHRHPVDYIPSFAFEYIYCSATLPK